MRMWKQFDINEISLLILIAVSYVFFFLLLRKKLFKPQITLFSMVWGFTVGVLFDFTIGGGPQDYYKVNDSNHYEVTDLLYYLLYSPFGYFFFYYYYRLKINKKKITLYVIVWALFGVSALWLFTQLGIITLQKGYKVAFSFPVFLVVQTLSVIFYEQIKNRENIFQSPTND